MARGKSNHTMFNEIMGNLEKNAGNRGHNIIFFPYYFNCYTKRAQKSNGGKIYDIFSPLGHAIIVLSQTMYWGENMARGKSNHTMFHKNYGKLSKKCRP